MGVREQWNARYASPMRITTGEPNPFLREHLALLPKGHVLELAMGEGHDAVFLANHGFSVTGVDISDVGVERAVRQARLASVGIEAQQVDLRTANLPSNTYDVVVCFYYLQRDLFPQIVNTLRPGGMVIYETFTTDQVQYGHPTNPTYLLQPNELLMVFNELRIRVYRDVVLAGPKAIASLIGEKVARQ